MIIGNAERSYVSCPKCGRGDVSLYRYPDSSYGLCCYSCFESRYNKPMQSYSFKPTPVFVGKNDGESRDYHIGIEIEVEYKKGGAADHINFEAWRDDYAAVAARSARDGISKMYWPMIYFKTDRSLENGLEIITHPMSHRYINDTGLFIELFDSLKAIGFKGGADYTRCGTHYHISKAAFGKKDIYRMLKLVYSDMDDLYKLSGRKDFDQFSKYAADASFDVKNKEFLNIIKSGQTQDRHVAMNVTAHTLEFRFFAGVGSYKDILKQVKTLRSIINYAISPDVDYKNLTIKNLLKGEKKCA